MSVSEPCAHQWLCIGNDAWMRATCLRCGLSARLERSPAEASVTTTLERRNDDFLGKPREPAYLPYTGDVLAAARAINAVGVVQRFIAGEPAIPFPVLAGGRV